MQDSQQIFDVTPETFQSSVVERSRQVPVILLFWADQVLPSVEVRRDLEQLARPHQGKVFLGLVDVARDPTLAQHLRVQGLPSIRVVHQGQIVHQLDGPQPESALRALLDQLTLSPADRLREELADLLAAGQLDHALAMLRQAVNDEPQNMAFRVELADVLARTGAMADARQVLDTIPAETEERDRPQTRIELREEADGLEPLEALQARHQEAPEDLDARYALAVRLADGGDAEAALEHALAILRADRTYRDDLGRLTMIRIFRLLGKGSELASRYRRRMFNFMH